MKKNIEVILIIIKDMEKGYIFITMVVNLMDSLKIILFKEQVLYFTKTTISIMVNLKMVIKKVQEYITIVMDQSLKDIGQMIYKTDSGF